MKATRFLSSASLLTVCSLRAPAVPFLPQNVNQRVLLSSSPIIKRPSIGFNRNVLSFSTKAGEKGGMDSNGAPTTVPVQVAHELLQAGHLYLDVRTPEEFSKGHVSGATNIPYMYRSGSGMTTNTKFLEEVASHYGKTDEILVGCQSGKRSMMAATDLAAAGFTRITDVAGGFGAWMQTGLPTEN